MNNNIPNNNQIPRPTTINPNSTNQTINQQKPVQPVLQNTNNQIKHDQPNQQFINNQSKQMQPKKKKSHNKTLFILLLLIIIGFMGYYIFTDYQKDLKNKCSPLASVKNKTTVLDLNSTIVQDLYSKVKTNIKEDIANNELNDQMKLYLAYRQIPNYKIYDSNCNLFDNTLMPSIQCNKNESFIPKAFKEETIQIEIKKLFGENTIIENQNLQLGNSCFGGYQYISERGEYVKGDCNITNSSLYNVDKKLISATIYNDIITLKEKVRYYGSEEVNIDRLKNGIYVYKFKLDNNYNYIYISRTIEQK